MIEPAGSLTLTRGLDLEITVSRTLAERCAAIEMLVLDVDGVLTDGGIIYTDAGTEVKQFHVRDGSGLKLWALFGKQAAILTGRKSPLVDVRAAELDIKTVLQGLADKLPAYRRLIAEKGLTTEQVCYIGDDLPDLPMFAQCGLAVAVADACPDARAFAHHVTHTPGGRGAVREVIELILQSQGLWAQALAKYRSLPPP